MSSLSNVQKYDVYYYNANMNTVWIYHDRVTGTLTGVSPNQTAPTAVTVAGVSYNSGTASVGRLVTVSTTQSGTKVRSLSTKRLEGTVSKDGTTFAGYDFASGVEILDTDDNGGYARIYPSRLAGAKLSGNDVRCYTLDANGDIDRMVLRNVTGDTQDYVYVSSIDDRSTEMNISVSYTYLLNGQPQSLSGSAKYPVRTGGAVLVYEDGKIKSIRQLTSVTLDSVSSLTAMGGGKEYKLSEGVQVLLRDGTGSGYYLTDLSQINGEDYTLTGWYDTGNYSAGGRLRIIVAVPK